MDPSQQHLENTVANALSTRVPHAFNGLIETEKKIGGIIDWCTYNYLNSDKEMTFEKTKEYTNIVLSNVLFYINYSSKELVNLLDVETQEVERLTSEVQGIASVRV